MKAPDAVISDHDHVPRTPERPSERVEAELRRRVEAGEWASGDALPTVARLAEHYGVARGSVARALRALADDGLVRIVPRWGTFRAGVRSRPAARVNDPTAVAAISVAPLAMKCQALSCEHASR